MTHTTHTVLIVEEHAHWRRGHYPNRFVELADAYAALGYRVEILTSRGTGSASPRHRVHRFSPPAFALAAAAAGLRRTSLGRRETVVRRVSQALGMATCALATRSRSRLMDPKPDAVVMLGVNTNPALVAALSGPGDWLLYQFNAPNTAFTWKSSTTRRLTDAWARRNVARHRAGGGRFRLASAHEGWRDEWMSRAPFLDPVVLPIAGVRPFVVEPDARARLDDGSGRRVALLFGAGMSTDRETALRAFADINGWRLVIAGAVGEGLDPSVVSPTISIFAAGEVDEPTRNLLFSAADLVVLSFNPAHWNDSGVLMDAISAGLPVVCSEQSSAGAIVDEYRLGPTFPPGDFLAMRHAVEGALDEFDPDGLARGQEELSNRAVTRHQLAALGVTPLT